MRTASLDALLDDTSKGFWLGSPYRRHRTWTAYHCAFEKCDFSEASHRKTFRWKSSTVTDKIFFLRSLSHLTVISSKKVSSLWGRINVMLSCGRSWASNQEKLGNFFCKSGQTCRFHIFERDGYGTLGNETWPSFEKHAVSLDHTLYTGHCQLRLAS